MPLISVLMPVFNGATYLESAVNSILSQTFSDFELVIVNDGSTDNTLEILQSFSDDRVKVINNERNKGIVRSLNIGLENCSGEFIARMDADDIAMPERFAQQIAYFKLHSEVGVVDTVQNVIDSQGISLGKTNSTIIATGDIYKTLPFRNCLGHPSVMVNGNLLRRYKYRDVAYEDYDLWLRMAADGVTIAKLSTPLLLFREHGTSITGKDHAGLRHFLKIIDTKRFYLSQLNFTEAIAPFSLAVRLSLMRDIATHTFKKIKSLFRRL